LLAASDGGDEGGSTGVFVTGGATSSGGAAGITIDTTNSAGGFPVGGSPVGGWTPAGGPSSTGGTPSAGGMGGGDTGGSSIPLTGNCANLTCLNPLNDLLSACQVGANEACTQQNTMTPATSMIVINDCYASGVKMHASMGMDMSSATITVKNGSSICYSLLMTGILSGVSDVSTLVFRNSSGATVATIAVNNTTSVEMVTCPGGTPTVVDATCGNSSGNLSSTIPNGLNCTPGYCAF
jgi:hypothetical protein